MGIKSLALIGLALCVNTAWAQDEEASTSPHSWAVTFWGTSDYKFRGVSQNDENPAFQAALDYSHESGFYAGIWGSAVDFGEDTADIEVDTYVGYGWQLGEDWKADISLLRYNYPGDNDAAFAYNELIGKLTYGGWLTGTIGYSNDVFNLDETGVYFGLGATHALPADFTLSAGVGYYDFGGDAFDAGDSYIDYNVGLTHAFGPFEATLAYIGTNGDGEDLFGTLADDKLVVTIKLVL